MRCEIHCPTKSSGIAGTAAAVAVAALAALVSWWALGLAAPFLLPMEAAALAAVVAARRGLLRLAPKLQWTARVSLVSGPLAAQFLPAGPPGPAAMPDLAPPLALSAGRLAIEAAPLPGVTVTLSARDYVRLDHQDQATGRANRAQQNKPRSTGQA